MIEGNTLSIDVYYEDVGIIPPGIDTSRPTTQIPQNTEYQVPDACIAEFIVGCKEARDEIDTCLQENCWAQVNTGKRIKVQMS